MGQSSTVRAVAAHSNGAPLIGKTKEFKAPNVEKMTESVGDGRFVEGTRVKGVKVDNWSFKQEGMTASIAKGFGLAQGDVYSVTFKEAVENDEGDLVNYVHEITGQVVKSQKDSSKVGDEDVWDTEGYVDTYKMTIDGEVIHDINVKTQKVICFGEDLTSRFVDSVR